MYGVNLIWCFLCVGGEVWCKMSLLRLNGAPAAQLASPVRALCCASFASELVTMAPGKYLKLCCLLSCNSVGYNGVASSRMFSTLWRVSRDYQGLLLSSRHGYRALASMSVPFLASQFSTSQLSRKKKLPTPRAVGTSLQDLFKQDLQTPFNIDPSYVALFPSNFVLPQYSISSLQCSCCSNFISVLST